MAGSVNKVTLIGRLGKDPEVKALPNGTSVANFSVATSESWNDKNGQKQEKTEWHRVVVFAKLADLVSKYVKKGSQLYLEGKLQTRSWTDKDGNTKYTTEIVASQVTFLGGKSSSQGSSSSEHEGSDMDQGGDEGGGGVHLSPDTDGEDTPF
jgi:single-strand DNA-binding protein